MTALQELLHTYRQAAVTEREKGTYFEELMMRYFAFEPMYKDKYAEVWLWEAFKQHRIQHGFDDIGTDAGIDLVAKTRDTNEYCAIQCKFYAQDYSVKKSDIDSFFTASGNKLFSHRIIVSTTNHWSEHAEAALSNQHIPVIKLDLNALEESVIDWSQYQPKQDVILKPKKQLRDHQKTAINAVEQGFATAERGKLIMACGTGKTFTSLKIAEKLAGKGKRVLFLVPSLSLLSQTLTEWTQESETPLHSFAVCSDSDVGKKRKKEDDIVQTFTHELRYPATTDAKRLAEEMLKRHDDDHMSVVFSTYHSINVISDAQNAYQLAEFDLVICDEAHRTTGATFDGDDESNFVLIHDGEFIHAKKRLYMTATPRIYGENAKASADKDNVTLCSMDNAALFGQELYTINFSEAVKRELLVDYKVIVLAVDESHINARLQSLLKDEDNQLKVDDAAKIVGCWKALSKHGTQEDLIGDTDPMRRAVAFCQVIEPNYKGNTHKVSSKNIAKMFQAVVEAYQEQEADKSSTIDTYLQCQAEHVDGSMNASQKEEKLSWLKEQTPDNTCRILSNVRCLSEGVDVPALDAVLFLTPRNSQVDVVQSVGRVMRKAEGKKRGYVILPVVIPAGVEPHEALNDNKTYKVVWQVLQALRSHDDRFDAMINKMDLDLNAKMLSKMEVIAITDKINPKTKLAKGKAGRGGSTIGKPSKPSSKDNETQHELEFEVGEIERAIYAKVVQKCGNRQHWEDWANDIAKIANTHISRIQAILDNPNNTAEIAAFTAFAEELRDDLNNAISNGEIVEMLAQHLITKPVFDALFSDYSFAKFNPMSIAMQDVLDKLHEHQLEKETDTLQRFYDSVQERAKGIDSAAGKQKIVVELYDKFFRNAFPKMTERLGIVYTPVEVVDFIIHSVNDALKNEFGQTLGDKNVHIIDPFTGTGTFITRLLQSGLISDAQLPYKYKNEIHANELVLLAYYIAAINIEAVYHDIILDDYAPFNGICLTDTFQMYEKEDMIDKLLVKNSARRKRQKSLDIRVIIGNPPYSAGQESANDNNANVSYPHLDERIRSTYAEHSKATLKNALYDSYIRAIRWASDRVGTSGVMGFVTNAGFIEANTGDGLRKCLVDEFSSIYVFHLRGNQRTSGELSRKEGGKIFGSGSRAPIAITIFVKNPNATEHGKIYFCDIGDYLSQTQKLEKITQLQSINGITAANGWQTIIPDEHNDWLSQRDDSFSEFISLGDKKDKDAVVMFENYSSGVKTNRDAWCYNFSKIELSRNMKNMIDFYNQEVNRYKNACDENGIGHHPDISNFIDKDPTKISWTREIQADLGRFKTRDFISCDMVYSLYRPFSKQWMYFNSNFNNCVYQMPKIFPNTSAKNQMIYCSGSGNSGKDFSTIITDNIPDLNMQHSGGQGFPLYLYEPNTTHTQTNPQGGLFDEPSVPTTTGYTRRDAITDAGLKHFTDYYQEQSITKEDLFYYIYGLLHSIEYKTKYADNLTKELPRIPRVKKLADFWAFSQAGRKLAELHINYETVKTYTVTFDVALDTLSNTDFYVKQMKFAKKGDKSTVIYNSKITIKNIPVAAYDYVVNGKPALEWVMERQAVTTHKDSGIVNDANDWAIETMNNPRYPLELFLRVITVSLETMEIVNGLPKLEIE